MWRECSRNLINKNKNQTKEHADEKSSKQSLEEA